MTSAHRSLSVVLIALLLASCGPRPPSSPHYLKAQVPEGVTIGPPSRGRTVDQAGTKVLGVLFSDNVQTAETYLAGVSESFAVLNPFAASDIDAAYFRKSLATALNKRFARVLYLDGFHRAKPTADIHLVVDFQTKLGFYSGTVTRASVNAILLDRRGDEISRASGKGESTVPFPAATLRYQDTIDEALGDFSSNLDRALR